MPKSKEKPKVVVTCPTHVSHHLRGLSAAKSEVSQSVTGSEREGQTDSKDQDEERPSSRVAEVVDFFERLTPCRRLVR